MSEVGRKARALVRLGLARQAPLDEAGQQVYAEGLAGIGADIVEIACQQLARRPKAEYASAYPSLGTVLEACRAWQAQIATRTETSRLLTAPTDRPVDPERLKQFRQDVTAFVVRRRMR